ncbi:MAG: BamA/TamA family outer membrane protein [Bacteroidetes bacterium]|nr:BamA/TamA family outer membrane protein [Bacteroidota bacterium]
MALLFSVIFLYTACRPIKYVPEGKYLLRKVDIKCKDKTIDIEELEGYLKQKPNRRLLGRIPFHLGIYNLVDPEKEAIRKKRREEKLDEINNRRRWKGKEPREKFYFTAWLQQIGEPPVIWDDYLTQKTIRQFRLYLRNKGYYSPVVYDTTLFFRKRAFITYTVVPKQPYIYRQIDYRIEDPAVNGIVIADTANSLLKPENLFDVDILQAERERITRLLKCHGYYTFAKEYIDYQVDTSLSSYSVDLTLRLKSPARLSSHSLNIHKKYRLNKIYIYPDFDPKKAIQEKERYYASFDTLEYNGYYFVYESRLNIKPEVIVRAISVKSGDLYDLRKVENSYKYLSSLQVFKLTNILFEESENGAETDVLDCHIQLTPFTSQSHTVELEGTNTSGNLGVAANFKYQHKNLFRGAELFEVKFKGAMEAQTKIVESSSDGGVTEYLPFNTIELGPESSLRFPKILLPFKLAAFTRAYHPKTTVSSAYNYQRRPEYSRTILTGKIGYFWKGARNATHFINPVELNSIKLTDVDPAFKAHIDTSFFKYSYDDQLIICGNYSYIYTNQNIRKLKNFIYVKTGIETAGNVFALYDKVAGNTVPGETNKLFEIEYAQYLKYDFDFSIHQIINPENKIVYHALAGIGYPYGNSAVMPFVKQYFSGGANSIRAWPVRTIGPGTFNDTLSVNLTSDMKIEANLEYRFDVISLLEGALFIDMGNIWSINEHDERPGVKFNFGKFYKELAIGAGFGARLDFGFFVLRLDFGYKVCDPSEPEGSRLVIGKRPFGRSEYSWNLGIGYPF